MAKSWRPIPSWTGLSDDELKARLLQRPAMSGDAEASRLVANRDDDGTAFVISHWLGDRGEWVY